MPAMQFRRRCPFLFRITSLVPWPILLILRRAQGGAKERGG